MAGTCRYLFHPSLQTGEERLEVLEEVLACAGVAKWVRGHAGRFGLLSLVE